MGVKESSATYASLEPSRVSAGYKRSEIGLIPQDWEVNVLGALIRTAQYGTSAKSRTKGMVPVLRMGNLQDGKILWDDLVFTSDQQEIDKYTLRRGDVLFNRTNTVGLVGKSSLFTDPQRAAIFAGYLIRIETDPLRLESRFLNFVLNAEFSKKHSTKVLSVAVGQANINGQKLRTYPIPTPSLKEQGAIADALSDADDLIDALSKLIAKKRQIKQGAMQVLLTGKERLPGFTKEWRLTTLEDVGDFFKGRGVSRDQSRSGSIPCVRYGELYTHHDEIIRGFRSFISESVARASFPLKQGDVLFAGSGETKADIGKCAALVVDVIAYAGGDIVVFRPRGCDSRFLGYALNTAEVNARKASLGQGDAVVHISSTALASVSLLLPEFREQTAIADVLCDMDAEITALEARLDKARQLKQGMMQQLLTGRIRLPLEPSA